MKIVPNQLTAKLIACIALVSLIGLGSQTIADSKTLPYFSKGSAQILPVPSALELPEGFVECDDLDLPEPPLGLPLGTVAAVDEGCATYLGNYQSAMELDQIAISLNEVVFYGPTIITGARGDQLVSLLNVVLTVNPDGTTGDIVGTYTVMGGTGRWAGACGEGLVIGSADLLAGSFDYITSGSIERVKRKSRRDR